MQRGICTRYTCVLALPLLPLPILSVLAFDLLSIISPSRTKVFDQISTIMDVKIVPMECYDSTVYNTLPDFPTVAKAFKARQGKFFIRDVRKVFLIHKVEKHLGIGLVHAHFDLAENERLVQEGLTSKPWDVGALREANIVASSWTFRDAPSIPTNSR